MNRCCNALILAVVPALLAACAGDAPARPEPESMSKTAPVPPIAAVRPRLVESPNGARTDEYYWLRDDTRANPEVIGYLEAENAYKSAMTAHSEGLEDKVYWEIVGRIKQDDSTVPYHLRGHWYYTRYETGQEYPVYARKAARLDAREQVMLDVNAMAEGHGFFRVGSTVVAPDNNLLAFTEDPVGRRQYTLRIKNLATGELLPDRIENVEPYLAWTADSRSILYLEKDPETLLARRVRRHVLGTDPAADALVYEQDDDSFYTSVGTTKDERYITIFARSTVSTEMRYADAADPALAFRVFLPRERDHRVLRRPPRRPLDHPHQLAGAELPPDGGGRRRGGRPRELARAARAPRGRIRRRLRRVQRFPRHRGTLGRDAQDPHPAVGRRQGLLHRLRRARLHDEPRRQRRDRHDTSCATSTPR